ncbi:MAG: hypothetical protein L0241_27255 [Planctomycetia bacterium]|nr:hypothetical protein [Planctomycetia bacterium]
MFGEVLRKLGSLIASSGEPMKRVGGRVWHLSPEGEIAFRSAGPDLDAWIKDGSAVVVKSGPHRTVYRVALACGVVYVKHCRINGPRAWLREVLRPPKAQLEFENAARLRSLGIGAAVPLAWGTRDTHWPGESFLITRDLAPAIPFTDFIEERFPNFAPDVQRAIRRQLARELARFLALLHDHGIAHPDPHPGNLLIELPDSRVPKFSLLDVHAVRFGSALSWAESRANLILYNRWFQLRASRSDRLRFWHIYRASRETLSLRGAEQVAAGKELERATLASNRRFWLARTARFEGTHRTIRRVRVGNVRGIAVRDLPEEFLRTLLADPDAIFTQPGAKLLKQCVSSTVAEVQIATPDGIREVILKRVNVRNTLGTLKNLFRSSGARRSWILGHGLCERWLPTPRPLAMVHRYKCGLLPAEGYLLTEKVPEAIGLPEAVLACRDTRILRAWSERLARVVRAMHDRGISHRDLKAPNVMLQGAARDPESAVPVLIDLVGVRASSDSVPFVRRAKELARLNVSFLAMPHVTRTERLRFLRIYLAAGESKADWKKWWKAVSVATAEKVAKNLLSGRVIG